ncbi:MAG: GNAT family N-acetyltransferase [Patescibacteria group bacterium]
MHLLIRKLQNHDAEIISSAFNEIRWNKPASQYKHYFTEQKVGKRLVLVAFVNKKFVGYLTIVWKSNYPPFKNGNIPEVVDLNVLPKYQRQKIGTKLMDEAEKIISKKSKVVGIGVGLAPGYNAAQRMYVRRGFIPDGLGVEYNEKSVKYGQKIVVDDSLTLHFTKRLNNR